MSTASYHRFQARRDEQAARARRTRYSDYPTVITFHRWCASWGGIPGECGAECSCGLVYDGFDRIAEASGLLDRHIAAFKPNHAARAVDIATCFPDAPTGDRAHRPGTGVSTHPTPLTGQQRAARYFRQNGRRRVTARQRRRLNHKEGRAMARDAA